MNASSRFTFTKDERIKKTSEFNVVYVTGKRYYTKNLIMYRVDNGRTHNRLGLSVSKKVGQASVRNHWKRRLREYFRLNKEKFGQGQDIVIVVKKEASVLEKHEIWKVIKNEMAEHFQKIIH